MKLSEIQFGYADAEREFLMLENFFDVAFVDPYGILDRLINDIHFILVGRKGAGKTAYSAKIRSSESHGQYELMSFCLPLNEFEYSIFQNTNVDESVMGTKRYKSSWDFMMLLLYVQFLHNSLGFSEVSELNNVVNLLAQLGFTKNEQDFKRNTAQLSKFKMGVNIGILDAEIEGTVGSKPDNYLERLNYLNEIMIDAICASHLGNKRVYMILDGIDDILRFENYQVEILSSLIRSVDFLNKTFQSKGLMIKTIVCIREDILALVNDTDINKVKRDCSIRLTWSDNRKNLKKLIEHRLSYSGFANVNCNQFLNDCFPAKLNRKPFWDYLLEHTLYKPRDILQFFKICQEMYPNSEHVSIQQVNAAMKNYSSTYLIEEMKNELSGFIDSDLITILPSVFRRFGRQQQSLASFKKEVDQQSQGKPCTVEDIRALLAVLYDTGYLGQIHKNRTTRGTINSVVFKYRNPTAHIDYSQYFIIHRGIYVGLGIRVQ